MVKRDHDTRLMPFCIQGAWQLSHSHTNGAKPLQPLLASHQFHCTNLIGTAISFAPLWKCFL